MNLLLNEYADNPIIDEVVYWPPRNIRKIMAKEKPIGIEVIFSDNTKHFTPCNEMDQSVFDKWWQEAQGILKLVTNIDVKSEAKKEQINTLSKEFTHSILEKRRILIDECFSKLRGHENDEFAKSWFFEQFGFNCAELPRHIQVAVDNARKNT